MLDYEMFLIYKNHSKNNWSRIVNTNKIYKQMGFDRPI